MELIDKFLIWLPTILAMLINASGAYIIFKKAKPEINKTTAEATSADAQAAQASATAVKMYAEELTSVRTELKQLRQELDSRDKIIMDMKTVLEDTKDWAERLSHQVISLGGIPVKFRSAVKAAKTPD